MKLVKSRRSRGPSTAVWDAHSTGTAAPAHSSQCPWTGRLQPNPFSLFSVLLSTIGSAQYLPKVEDHCSVLEIHLLVTQAVMIICCVRH